MQVEILKDFSCEDVHVVLEVDSDNIVVRVFRGEPLFSGLVARREPVDPLDYVW